MATKLISGLEIPLEPIDDTAFHEAKRLGSTNPPLANPDPRLVSRLHGQPTNKQLVFHGEDATSCSLVPAASVTQDPDDLDITFQPSKYLSYKGVSQSFARSPRPENLRSYPAHSHHYGGRLLRTSICLRIAETFKAEFRSLVGVSLPLRPEPSQPRPSASEVTRYSVKDKFGYSCTMFIPQYYHARGYDESRIHDYVVIRPSGSVPSLLTACDLVCQSALRWTEASLCFASSCRAHWHLG